MKKYEKFDKEIIKLSKEGKRPCEISKIIKIDSRRVIDRLKANKITDYKKGNSNERKKIENDMQHQILIGTIIGDGCIFKGKKNKNYRMNLAHGIKQKEYFLYKYNVLKTLGFNKPKEEIEMHSKVNKKYSCIKTQSLTNPLFTELYNTWYKNGKKIIPKDKLYEIGDLAIAIKFYDDGYKQKKTYCISMNNYDIESINNFRTLLLNNYNIETTIQKGGVIYIRKNSSEKFRNIVKKYATSDVLYKLGELLETP